MDKKNTHKITMAIISRLEWTTTFIVIVAILVCIFFLYNNLYQCLGDINVLSKIKGQVAVKVVDMKLWEKIKNADEAKKQALEMTDIKNNPF